MSVTRLHVDRRGAAAVAVVASLLVVNLIIVGLAVGGARDQDLTARRVETIRAFYAAEAGANMAVRELMLDSDEDGDGAVGTISADGNSANDPAMPFAPFMVDLVIDGAQSTITSAGRSGDATRTIELVLQ
jgi:Tfp pilus assembly protein PilX